MTESRGGKFVPVEQTISYKYTKRIIQEYIERAYGDKIKLKEINPNLSCAQRAIEALGYEYQDGDWYFPCDPDAPKPPFALGDIVVTEDGGVGMILHTNSSNKNPTTNPSYSIRAVIGWKPPLYCAWYAPKELRLTDIVARLAPKHQ